MSFLSGPTFGPEVPSNYGFLLTLKSGTVGAGRHDWREDLASLKWKKGGVTMKRLVLQATAFLLVSVGAFAQPWGGQGPRDCPRCGPGGGPGFGPFGMFRCVLDSPELALTGEQQKEINRIRDEARQEAWGFFNEMQALKDEFLQAFSDPATPKEKLREIGQKIRDRRQKAQEARLEALLKVRSVLTPEQIQKVPGLVEKCRKAHPRHRRWGW